MALFSQTFIKRKNRVKSTVDYRFETGFWQNGFMVSRNTNVSAGFARSMKGPRGKTFKKPHKSEENDECLNPNDEGMTKSQCLMAAGCAVGSANASALEKGNSKAVEDSRSPRPGGDVMAQSDSPAARLSGVAAAETCRDQERKFFTFFQIFSPFSAFLEKFSRGTSGWRCDPFDQEPGNCSGRFPNRGRMKTRLRMITRSYAWLRL